MSAIGTTRITHGCSCGASWILDGNDSESLRLLDEFLVANHTNSPARERHWPVAREEAMRVRRRRALRPTFQGEEGTRSE